MKLSVLIPVYNEALTIEAIVRRVAAQRVPGIDALEIIVVNDGSTDKTADVLRGLIRTLPGKLLVMSHPRNQGKGAAVATAVRNMSGDIAVIQDGDLEYDPAEYSLLLEPIIQGRADVVFGSRFTGSQAKRVLYFWHYVGNSFLTMLSNMFTNINLTDMETGFKAFRAEALRSIPLYSKRFGFEPEITAKVARRKLRLYEVGISYNGRTYADGKKILWWDGVKAIGTILRYAWFD